MHANNHKLTCGSNTVTIKVDPSRTPTVATSSNRTFFAADADADADDEEECATTETRTGASSCGATRPLARASSCATSRRNHSTQAAIFACARAYSSRAAGSASACCEPGVREAVAIGERFFEPLCGAEDGSDSDSASALLLPPPFWRCFDFALLVAYARVRRVVVVVVRAGGVVRRAVGAEIARVMDRRRLWRRSDDI